MLEIETAPAVAQALAAERPVVALETTLICHGLPRPRNREIAQEMTATVREAGAEPAVVAVLDGRVRIGLADAELDGLAVRDDITKCTSRDIARLAASGASGATTVAATIALAHQAGIRVMATGGLGGVHRGAEESFDISADLGELARRPVAVVASGAKAVLDLPRTLELLETLSVPVVGWRTAEFPAFYTGSSGLGVPRIDDLATLARQLRLHGATFGSGTLVCQPPPADAAMAPERLEALIDEAIKAARAAGIGGAGVTPFLLDHLARASGGATVELNAALVLANARLAAELAGALALAP